MILTYKQIYSIAVLSGFTGDSANIITAIALAESGGDTTASNLSDPNGGSWGILQINGVWFSLGFSIIQAMDAQQSFKFAYDVISHRGIDFNAWSTYTNGQYKKFMAGAPTVAGTVQGSKGDTTYTYILSYIIAGILLIGISKTRVGYVAIYYSLALLLFLLFVIEAPFISKNLQTISKGNV